MFSISANKGFQIKFNNGWTVSVQWGPGNYCDNRNMPFYQWFVNTVDDKGMHTKGLFNAPPSATAEIAAWDANGNWYTWPNGDDVKGYCLPDEVLGFLNLIASK